MSTFRMLAGFLVMAVPTACEDNADTQSPECVA